MKNYSHFKLVFVLMPFAIGFAFGLDVYIPILSQMTTIFQTTPSLIKLTMSLFLFSVAIGQLLIGPLSDHFGRKKVLFISSLLFSVGSLACTFSTEIASLIAMRVISGLGACGMLVTSLAIVRDLLSKDESASVFGFLNGATGVSPTFAPIFGGYLAFYWGWQAVFIFLAFLGMGAILVNCYFIEETLPSEKRVKFNSKILQRYYGVYRNRQFLIFASISGFAQAVFFGFFSVSPFIIIDLLHVLPEHFGYYFASFGAVLCLGGLTSGKLIEKFGIQATFKIGILLMLSGGILMLGWSMPTTLTLASFLIPMMIACTGAIFLVGSSLSVALEPFPTIAGTASAAFGCLAFGICSFAATFLMLFPIYSTTPYSIYIILMALFSGGLFILQEKPDPLEANEA